MKLLTIAQVSQSERPSENFTWHEMMCHNSDGSPHEACNGKIILRPELLEILEAIRAAQSSGPTDSPLNINSWTRCKVRNKEVNGKNSSAHLSGFAVDIKAITSRKRSYVLSAIYSVVDKPRVGIAGTFIHFDVDSRKPTDVAFLYSN